MREASTITGVGIQITVLGSGSAGNCTFIETANTAVLIDAGLSGRQISQRLATIGRQLDDLDAILVTHEHSDHVRGLGAICKKHPVAVYANRLTAEAINEEPDWTNGIRIPWRVFANGQTFSVGDLTVEPFSIPHDAFDPVAFTLHHGTHAIGVVTDLGHATKLVVERVRQMDFLILESNHDVRMLQDDTIRPWATRQRIMSRHGHLNNEAAAAVAAEVVSDRLRHLVLAHLSRDCNKPELAQTVVGTKLRQLGATHVHVTAASQDQPTATVQL
ncbi:MAG: putative metallo-hydrolase YycJ [Verrucomicrobiae bacterium]|nr:putative metallo-hydrolase YycJ [Verrucomicrobiae bacterium]